MEPRLIILVSICISAVIKSIFNILFTTKKPSQSLPPGPSTFPFIPNFLWLRKSSSELEHSLQSIHAKFGPIVTLWIGYRPAIFIGNRSLAHQALIQNGANFEFDNRSKPLVTNKIFNISSAFYGPTWCLLRRNLTSEILHPSRIKSYSHARNWVLKILLDCFKSQYKSGRPIYVLKHFQHAMFCLLVLMCFGDKLETKQIKTIEDVHRGLLLNISRFNILNFWPSVTKIIFRKRWKQLLQVRRKQEEVLIPLIRARRNIKEETSSKVKQEKDEYLLAYVDTLFELQLPEENRKLKEEEMASLCSEFLGAGTDNTSTALQWVMANLVKNKIVQDKLYREIKGVMGEGAEMVKEDDLHKMPYLKAVVLESLRRHPPAHLVLPHVVTEDVALNGCLLPKNGTLNFMFEWTAVDGENVDLSEKQEFTTVMKYPLKAQITPRFG
ncbi:hypothetical protein REPUB_Repub06bG0083500 [Reevesia pubescens]